MYIRYMGSNRRYGSDVRAETLARFMSAAEPVSLTREECGDAVTQGREPIAVRAWVRFGDSPAQVDARAIAWTKRAVCIEWRGKAAVHRAWVWASAVERV
jgi:hypothetical protein